ncbi:MAG: TIGR02281 family clan AA aspartic protease [Gammaproteobacteria bacterium]
MEHSTKKLGMMFTLGGWIIGILVLFLVFSKIIDYQVNPNQSVATSQSDRYQEITLKRNRNGHYVFAGEINRLPVTFLVDTGATLISIPFGLQAYLQLDAGAPFSVSTANGVTTAYRTRLDELKMGDIVLSDVRASLIPGLPDGGVLLGMNVLKNMELIQRGDKLIIRHYY